MRYKSKGFTLIELLVVIAIIGLLLSILIPALGRAKDYSYRVICSTNIRSQAQGIRLYSEQHDGSVPLNEGGNWLQDLSFWCTNQISMYSGIDHQSFYCPANKRKRSDDGRFWQFSWVGAGDYLPPAPSPITGPLALRDESRLSDTRQRALFRVMSYNYMFDRVNFASNPPASRYPTRLMTGAKPVWIRKISTLSNSSGTLMIVDNTISQTSGTSASGYNLAPPGGCNFSEVPGGGLGSMGATDSSNHFSRQSESGSSRKDISGVNTAYADGHVEWKSRKDLRTQIYFGQYFWW
jgi:prepilin-type N-terminal cleavage/methylation domain-containing protein/prepilin-type processing-associated H-X9-DG protein